MKKQVRKTPWLFSLTGNVEDKGTSPLRGTPASLPLPQGSRTQESIQLKCAVRRCLDSASPLTQTIKTWAWCLSFRKGKKVGGGGVEWGCRQKIPISILVFKLQLDKRETGLERPIQKSQTENRSQACVGSVVSHLSTPLGIHVGSPVSDPASHLALPLHICDFIDSRHHTQSAWVSQEAAGLGPRPTWSRKNPRNTAHHQMAFW